MLGTNDGHSRFWNPSLFKSDYAQLIEDVIGGPQAVQEIRKRAEEGKQVNVYLCTPPPVIPYMRYGIERRIVN